MVAYGCALLAAVTSLAGGAGSVAGATAPKPQMVLAANTVVIAPNGTAAVDVLVPKGGVELVETKPVLGVVPGFALLVGSDTWSSVAIIARGGTRVNGLPLHHVQVHLPAPDHCPATSAPTPSPPPPCRAYVEQTLHASPTTARSVGSQNRWYLPAGQYQIVLSGPAHAFLAAVLTFAGARGTNYAIALGHATATLQRARIDNLVLAHLNGTFKHKVAKHGIGVLGLWHTTAGDEPGEFSYAECVVAGEAEQTNPDDCFPRLAAGPGKVPGGKDPVWAAQSIGGATLDNSGQGTFETPLLKPGTYTNSYRVTRGGRGPAAGAFVLWLETDSLR
jgi:hypothetical protein